MDSLNILNTTITYHPVVGGAQHFVKCISEELVKRGNNVDVYATTAKSVLAVTDKGENFSPTVKDINGVRVSLFNNNYFPVKAKHILDRSTSIYPYGPWSLSMIKNLLRECRNYDLIHSTPFTFTHNYYVYLISKLNKVPIVFTPFTHTEDKFHFDRIPNFKILKNSDAVIVQTEHEFKYLEDKGVDSSKLFYGGMGVYPDEFENAEGNSQREQYGITDDDIVVLFLGRKEEYKGFKAVLDAVNILKNRNSIKFLCVGSATPFSKYIEKKYGKENFFINIDAVYGKEKIDLIDACDIFALPSLYESFGGVFLEAWMREKPVIGYANDAVKCVVSNYESGILVNSTDPIELAKAMLYLIKNPNERKRMGRNGKKLTLSNYTWKKVSERVENAFRSVVRT